MQERVPLEAIVAARSALVDPAHATAFRLFNGHLEGDPRFVIDVYGTTVVIFRDASPRDASPRDAFPRDVPPRDASPRGASPRDTDPETAALIARLHAQLPWLQAAVVKERGGATDEARRGRVLQLGPAALAPAGEIVEHGVRYALDLLMNQDASFYLDTRNLRRHLLDCSEGKRVLNTFAYTGSLGVAARAGGAAQVVHTDLNARFLSFAKASTALNGFPVERRDFQARNFFSFVQGAKRSGERFDTVIVDPPYFSATRSGTVDLARNVAQLINKVRPIVRSGGTLIVVNNALFLSGADYLRELERLCVGGWMKIEELIPVPDDVKGYPGTRVRVPPVDWVPFGHSTKIAVLTVRHK